ncbi:hypothetical protein BCV70DRAFT_208436 [Testicularia cyperi]|uniref:Uncharacterized protein n=1 Tax=Testicularia cyperi TaxID=1882483 RepID=A0A317XH33_9BASI|nr:hypothetical protein BCV70DRAFT_208436 [Testicularia cyperi]
MVSSRPRLFLAFCLSLLLGFGAVEPLPAGPHGGGRAPALPIVAYDPTTGSVYDFASLAQRQDQIPASLPTMRTPAHGAVPMPTAPSSGLNVALPGIVSQNLPTYHQNIALNTASRNMQGAAATIRYSPYFNIPYFRNPILDQATHSRQGIASSSNPSYPPQRTRKRHPTGFATPDADKRMHFPTNVHNMQTYEWPSIRKGDKLLSRLQTDWVDKLTPAEQERINQAYFKGLMHWVPLIESEKDHILRAVKYYWGAYHGVFPPHAEGQAPIRFRAHYYQRGYITDISDLHGLGLWSKDKELFSVWGIPTQRANSPGHFRTDFFGLGYIMVHDKPKIAAHLEEMIARHPPQPLTWTEIVKGIPK